MQSSYGQYGSNQPASHQQQQQHVGGGGNGGGGGGGGQMTPVHQQQQQAAATFSSDAISSIYARLEAMTKTQTDLITYLHAELDRRREWEDRMLKDVQNRHGVLVSLLSNMIGFPPPPPPPPPQQAATATATGGPQQHHGGSGAAAAPNALAGGHHHSQQHGAGGGDPAAAAAAAAAGITAPTGGGSSNGMQNGGGGSGGLYMGGGRHQQQQPAMNAYANHHHHHHPSSRGEPQHMGMNGGGGKGTPSRISISGHQQQPLGGMNRASMDGGGFHGLVDATSALGAAAAGGEGGGGAASSKTKRKRRGSDASSDDGANKAVEVDERGVVYMASGKKAGLKPTKIQALVRKTIWASMGPEAGSLAHPPSYVDGMAPPDGSRDWKFGNLRFEWEKTSKRSPHNNHMKQIIINHILNLRAEYPEVPDGDFQPAKMEAAFEQAFSTWRGKVLGRVKGRHDNDDD